MRVHILGVAETPTELLDLAPQHQVDFCDTCGDCLSCFGEDDCGDVDGRAHSWVVYPEDAAEFKARMLSGSL
jgi:hypothetical protein